MTLAWRLFEDLCAVTDQFETLRDQYPPGSNGWCALVELVQALDGVIDWLVETDGIEEEKT